MPYIKEEFRKQVDKEVDLLADKIKEIFKNNPAQTRDGLINYSLTRMINKIYPDARYHDFNEIIGVLECCKQEYYRVYVGPYEDLKAKENGSVKVFDEKNKSGY
jgi:hypothetical protein